MFARPATTARSAITLPKKNLPILVFSSDLLPLILWYCSLEEIVRFSRLSKESNARVKKTLQRPPKDHWEKQLLELGVDETLLREAKESHPDLDCRKWYEAWKKLFFYAPYDARVPRDMFFWDPTDSYFNSLYNSSLTDAADRNLPPYPVFQRPKAFQLMLSGFFPSPAEDIPLHDKCLGKKGANILHYAAWSGSFEALMLALFHPVNRNRKMSPYWGEISAILFCAERSGAVKTREQQLAVLSACSFLERETYLPKFDFPPQGRNLIYFLLHFSSAGRNFLHEAAKKGQIELLRFFEEKIDSLLWNCRSACGANVLHYAAQYAAKSGSMEGIEYLCSLQKDAVKIIGRSTKDVKGKTPADWVKEVIAQSQREIRQEKLKKINDSLLGTGGGLSAVASITVAAYSSRFFRSPSRVKREAELQRRWEIISALLHAPTFQDRNETNPNSSQIKL